MGFRFQKRIKLGKRFGVSISKSGITPSYRTKRGSLSSKGYSIRTGIPGLNYRKSFKKSKGNGCLMTLIFILLIPSFMILISCKNKSSNSLENVEGRIEYIYKKNEEPEVKEWYQGGTLHKSKITDWKASTDRNKLATCSDFCATIYKNYYLEEIKILATNLKACIDGTVKGNDASDNFEVSEVASMCLILLEN